MSADRAYRIWSAAGLQVPKKRPRPVPATAENRVWGCDFVFDACANGQQLKCLTVIDEYTRECLAINVAVSIRSSRVIEVLSKLISVHGAPDVPPLLSSGRVSRSFAPSFAYRSFCVENGYG